MPVNVRELPDDELNTLLDELRNKVPDYSSKRKTTKRRKGAPKEPTITQAALTALLAELGEDSNANTN